MAPPPTLPRQRLRYTRILDVAAGFARKGLDSVVLSEVAAKADVPLGTLYRYFPSATQLVLALYRKQLTELHAANSPAAGRQALVRNPSQRPVPRQPPARPPRRRRGPRDAPRSRPGGTPRATFRPTRSSAS